MGNNEFVTVGSIEGENKSYQEVINSKSFLKEIIENMADGVSILDTDGMHIDVNEALCKMTGYSKQELIGSKPPHPYWPKEEYETIQQAFQETMCEEVKNFSLIFKRKNGERFPVLVSPSLVKDSSGEVVCYYATVKDISQFQKIKDEKTIILNALNELFCYYTPDLKILWGNKAAADSVGMNAEELVGKHCYKLWNQCDQPCDDCPVLKAYETGKKQSVERKTPDDRYWRLYGYPIFDRDGSIKNLVELGLDITEKKKTEIALKENMEKYRTLFDTMAQGVIYQDANGKIISANPAAEQILGLSLSQMQGRTSMHPDWKAVDKDKNILPGDKHPAMVALRTGEEVSDFLQGIFNPEKNDYVWIIVNSVPQLKEGSDTPYQVYSTFLDVTDRINAEQNMEESEEKFKKLFENSQNGIVLCQLFKDEQGNPIDYIHLKVNPATERHLGYKPDALINKTATDLIGEEAGRLYAEKNGNCVITGESYSWVDFTPVYNKYLRMDSYHIKDDYFAITFVDITTEKLAQKKIEESEENYRTIFNHSTDAVFVHDFKTGKIIDVNQATMDTFGYSKDEIIEMDVGDLSINEPPYTQKEAVAWIQKAAHEGPQRFEWLVKNKEGELIWFENSLQLVQISGEQRILVMGRNITEKKKAEQALLAKEKRFRNLAELLPAAVVETDSDLQMTFANNHAFELMNYSKDDYIQGVNALELFPPDEHERVKKNLAKRMEGAHLGTVEYQAVKKNGERFPVLVHAAPMMKDGVFQGLRAVIVDITKIKEYREKLESLNNQLEQRVAERTERIHRLLQQKDEFINQLGHDLKNPLGPLIHLLPLVEEHVDDPKYKDMLQVAIRNTRYMKQLITKTIQLAQLKSANTELNYESLNLCEEVSEIVDTNQLMFEENQIKVQNNLSESLTVYADKLRMHEVFNNLLNNAVKYTDEKPGCITIDSSMDDDVIAISIKDSGIGMTGEQLDRVFDEFYKADSSRHDFDSSGLGMPICKRIVEMHGGKIWAESDGLGKGSTFYFSLPRS